MANRNDRDSRKLRVSEDMAYTLKEIKTYAVVFRAFEITT